MLTEYVCFDIETTGLNPVNEHIIEIGALKVKDNKIVDTFSELINPEVVISSKITSITNITNNMVSDKPNIYEVLPEFLEFCDTDIIMGHNIRFDFSFIKQKSLLINKKFNKEAIDTLKIARKALPELKSRSLGSLCTYFNVVNEHAHRAYDDALATNCIYDKLQQQFGQVMPHIFETQQVEYKPIKEQHITQKQIKYLSQLVAYHKIHLTDNIEDYTKSQASYIIDKIILNYGKLYT